MFSKDITTSDAFREMPTSAQALYFHLGMEADDDGFLDNYKGLMRAVNASEDDLRILIGKRFLILFPSKIIVVKHWLINNTVRADRYKETKYLDEKRALLVKENGAYTELSAGIPNGNQLATQYRIGEDRIVSEPEVRIETFKEDGEERAKPDRVPKAQQQAYEILLRWAENERGSKFVHRTKQYKALKEARAVNLKAQDLRDRWEEMANDKYWAERGFDWVNVVASFNRKGV